MTTPNRIQNLTRGVLLVVIASLLTSCSLMRSQRAEEAQRTLLGMKKTDLYACAGVPNRTEKVDDKEFLTYEGGGDQHGYAGGGGQNGLGGGSIAMKKRYCNANVMLGNGKVEKVSYSGRTGGYFTEGEQCAFILDPCLPKK